MFEVMSSREDLHDRSSLYCISSSLSAGICRIKTRPGNGGSPRFYQHDPDFSEGHQIKLVVLVKRRRTILKHCY